MKKISLQEAKDKKMFGPVFHGSSNQEQIEKEGFKIFIGDKSVNPNIKHGYQENSYSNGIPAPIHHLGYGVYFTTVKAIAKQFNGDTMKGLKAYYLDVHKIETINFGAPNTMMKWWIANGYDPKIAVTDRIEATKRLTNTLKSKHDAVWFKGKGIRRLLDGDQIVVFDTNDIYEIDPKLSKSGEVGSTVIRKSDSMKGIILNRRSIPADVRHYHKGSEEALSVKWKKGGTDYNVYPSDITFAGYRAEACFVAPIHNNKILIQKRPEGVWGLFGGSRLHKESPSQCALREFQEETGLRPNVRLRPVMKHGPYTVFSFNSSIPLRISKNEETSGYLWVDPQDLRRLNLIKEFRSYVNSFIKQIMEDTMAKGLKMTTANAIEILATLNKKGRPDLAREFGAEIFASKPVTKVTKKVTAENEAVLDGESIKILDEKAQKIFDEFNALVEKEAQGPVEADILRKHAGKLILTKIGVIVENEAEEKAEQNGEEHDEGIEVGEDEIKDLSKESSEE